MIHQTPQARQTIQKRCRDGATEIWCYSYLVWLLILHASSKCFRDSLKNCLFYVPWHSCSLSQNKISYEGTCALAGALQVNQSLQELEWVQLFVLRGVCALTVEWWLWALHISTCVGPRKVPVQYDFGDWFWLKLSKCKWWRFPEPPPISFSDILQPQWEQHWRCGNICIGWSFARYLESSRARVSPAIHVLLLKWCTLRLQCCFLV